MSTATASPPKSRHPGTVERGTLYTVDEACRRLRIGPGTWRRIREDVGVIYIGRGSYVSGDDLIDYFEDQKSYELPPHRGGIAKRARENEG